jgi:KaiC/GvpD/RAD55 family RecA-like ATPase
MTFTSAEVRAYYAARVPGVRITSQREWRGPCPVHQGKRDSFAVNAETGLAQCHSECARGWDVVSLEMELSGIGFAQAKERVYDIVGRPKVPYEERDIEATYDYRDENGVPRYQVVRKHGKQFFQRRPDGRGGYIWGLGNVAALPFNLPAIMRAQTVVAVTEGEKDALNLTKLGMTATCNSGGAGKFKPELAKWFTGKTVAIFPDNDEPGRRHAVMVAKTLFPVAQSLRIVEIPDLPLKGDVSDFIAKGGTLDQLNTLYVKAADWTPEWEFSTAVPEENERYVRTLEQEIEDAGGLNGFWDLAKFTGLPTPFTKLNWILGGGLRDGEVYTLGANMGAGKTSLALQFALAALRKRHGVLIFSMEMGWRAVFQRMAGIEAKVDLALFREAQRVKRDSPDDRFRLTRATNEIAGWKLLVSTKPAVTPDYIVNETKRLAKRCAVDLVIVDHMQLMGAGHETRNDYEKFTNISRAMKQTALEVNVPLLLVSQTSRSNSREHRADLEVSDLRGSGAIEEDAAGVFLLFEDRTDAENAKSTDDGQRYTKGPVRTFLKIGKNRYGEQGRSIGLLHYKGQTRFESEDERSRERQ